MNKSIDILYEENKNLIHTIIRRHFPHFVNTPEYEDAFQEGSIALLRAIERFKPEYGNEFSTYAYPAIKSTIYRAMYKSESEMKVSRNAHELHIKYKHLTREGYTFNEIVEKLNTYPTTLLSVINAYKGDHLESIIAEGENDKNLLLKDIIPDDEDFTEDIETKYDLKTAITLCRSLLSDTDFIIVTNYYNNLKQIEIAKKVSLTQASVSRRLTNLNTKVFPFFKDYLLGNLTYGNLCATLLNYNSMNVKYCIRGYFDYVLELICRGACSDEFLEEMRQALNILGSKAIKKTINSLFEEGLLDNNLIGNIKLIMTIIDKYFSENGIEEVIYNVAMIIKKEENKSYLNEFRLQLNTV